MRVDVVFTPDGAGAAPTGIVIDVIRATSTICQALASGYSRVFCAAEVEEARALRDMLGEGVLGGERKAVRIPGFDLGNSPLEYLEPAGTTLVLSTTNGTRAVIAAAERCERVLVASLLNLSAVVGAARAAGQDALVVCAGVQGTLALDDAYVAGRIVELLAWNRTDAAEAAARADVRPPGRRADRALELLTQLAAMSRCGPGRPTTGDPRVRSSERDLGSPLPHPDQAGNDVEDALLGAERDVRLELRSVLE